MDTRVVTLRAATLLASAALAHVSAPGAYAESVTYRTDVQHTGHVERDGPRPPLRLRWKARVLPYAGYPVVADGRVFVVTGGPWWLSEPVELVALSLRTGRRLWTRDLRTPERPNPEAHLAYDAGRLFVLREVGEPEQGGLLALSPRTGEVLWQTTALDRIPGPPVADGGSVYLGQSASGDPGASAWSQADGSLRWSVGLRHGSYGSPALFRDRVYIGLTCAGELARLNRADGSFVEPFTTDCGLSGVTPTSTLVSGGRALVHGTPPDDAIFDIETGARVSKLETARPPAVANGITITTVARRGSPFPADIPYRLVARTARGRLLWRFGGDGYLDTPPLVVRDTVYVGSGSGRIYAVGLRSGRLRWRGRAPSAVLGGPRLTELAAGGGHLVVPTYGQILAYGAR